MKKYILILTFIGLVGFASSAAAQMGMMMGNYGDADATPGTTQSQELEAALQSIYTHQGITSRGEIDCSTVTDAEFAAVGDAYMGVMMPNETQHEAMDEMMGGEGSASLEQAHINMGRSYLGCWSDYNSGPVYMPMMGGSGMIGASAAARGMMGWVYGNYYGGSSWASWVTTILVWILLIVAIAALGKWLLRKK